MKVKPIYKTLQKYLINYFYLCGFKQINLFEKNDIVNDSNKLKEFS